MENNDIKQLFELYEKQSKHSSYQILSSRLENILNNRNIVIRNRYEKERLTFIKNNVSIIEKSVLDIGGNTGFFSFEFIDAGTQMVHYYEGNADHAHFVKIAARILNVEKSIRVTDKYYLFQEDTESHHDICLLLNVLHHFGDDYGNRTVSIEKAKENILTQINSMATKTSVLIFQLGFNWKGNIKTSLFEHGTKSEMINFIKNGTGSHWNVLNIGIAERESNTIVYNSLNDVNIKRDDSLGEFLNRPIFILESK